MSAPNRKHLMIGVTGLAILLSPVPARAITWYILPDGTGDAPTIQAGIDSAAAGDTVLVACGTFYEHNISMKSGVCVRSERGDPSCVSVDAQGLETVFRCMSVEGATIEGLGISGAGQDGGVFCDLSSVSIRNCAVFGNTGLYGGGIVGHASSLEVSGCEVYANQSQGGGGISCLILGILASLDHGPPSSDVATLGNPQRAPSTTITDCRIMGNESSVGGGVLCYGMPVEITDCTISGNSVVRMMSPGMGGGVAVLNSECSMTNCLITGNDADFYGGGLIYEPDSLSALNITGCTIAGNRAAVGGGLCLQPPISPTADLPPLPEEQTTSGALGDDRAAAPTLDHTVVWGNCADSLSCSAEVYIHEGTLTLHCSVADSSGICGGGTVSGSEIVYEDPLFCWPEDCEDAPSNGGDYRIDRSSPCRGAPGCGRIGALGVGCFGYLYWEEQSLGAETLDEPGPTGVEDHVAGGVVYFDVCPNPARGSVTMRYELEAPSALGRVQVFDVTGRLVRSCSVGSPEGAIPWDGTDESGVSVGSGIYFLRLTAGGRAETLRIVLIK